VIRVSKTEVFRSALMIYNHKGIAFINQIYYLGNEKQPANVIKKWSSKNAQTKSN